MRRWHAVILISLLLAMSVGLAVASDSLRTADSLRDHHQELPLWTDSSLTHSDTLGGGQHMLDRWWVPLGVIILTGASAWLLFSTRSK